VPTPLMGITVKFVLERKIMFDPAIGIVVVIVVGSILGAIIGR
jgi:hypothetical protein